MEQECVLFHAKLQGIITDSIRLTLYHVSKIITSFFYEKNKADISSVIIASASTDKYMWAKLSMTYCYYFILMKITPCLNNQL